MKGKGFSSRQRRFGGVAGSVFSKEASLTLDTCMKVRLDETLRSVLICLAFPNQLLSCLFNGNAKDVVQALANFLG